MSGKDDAAKMTAAQDDVFPSAPTSLDTANTAAAPAPAAAVPAVRFAGEEGEWEERRLGEVVNRIVTGKLDANASTPNGEYAFFTCCKETLRTSSYSFDGDAILINGNGDLGYTRKYSGKFDAYQRTYVLQNFTVDFGFLECAIRHYLPKRITVESFGGAMPYIRLDTVAGLNLSLPPLPAQRRIGALFAALDRLISLYDKRARMMRGVKAALLGGMFPAEGKSAPRIRFEGEEGEWEKRRLGECGKITMGQSPDGSTYSNTTSTYILVQGNADIQNGWVLPRVWTTQMTKKADVGDLIMSVRAPAGAMGRTAYNVVIGRGVAAIKGNEFIYQSLIKMDNNGYWKKLACGTTFESLSSDDIKNAIIRLPPLPAQRRIGALFAALDRLIALYDKKARMMRGVKKGLLDKMFV